jgi:hypothetical protein
MCSYRYETCVFHEHSVRLWQLYFTNLKVHSLLLAHNYLHFEYLAPNTNTNFSSKIVHLSRTVSNHFN